MTRMEGRRPKMPSHLRSESRNAKITSVEVRENRVSPGTRDFGPPAPSFGEQLDRRTGNMRCRSVRRCKSQDRRFVTTSSHKFVTSFV